MSYQDKLYDLDELNKVYDFYINDDIEKELIEHEKSLDKYIYNQRIDYVQFSLDQHEKLVEINNTPSSLKNSLKLGLARGAVKSYDPFFLNLMLYIKILREISQLSEEDINKDADKYMNIYSKYKLLLSYLTKTNDRQLSVYFDIAQDYKEENLDENIKELDLHQVRHRFMMAIQKNMKITAFKLLGRMKELDDGEDYYFEALAHFKNKDYQDVLRFVDKINKNEIDYKDGLALKLDTLAIMGDVDNYEKCILENSDIKYDRQQTKHHYMTMITNKKGDFDKVRESSVRILGNRELYNQNDNPIIYSDTKLLSLQIIKELLEIYDELSTSSVDLQNLTPGQFKLLDIVGRNDLALDMFLAQDKITFAPNMAYCINSDSYEEYKENYAQVIYSYAFANYGSDNDFNKQYHEYYDLKACKILYDILIQLDNKQVIKQLEEAVINSGVLTNSEDNAVALVKAIYLNQCVEGNVNPLIQEYIEKEVEESLDEEVVDNTILSKLSKNGIKMYRSAEWQYQKSKEEDYGWKDAGSLSLSFYRIFEVEYFDKLIRPLVEEIDLDQLNTIFINHKNSLDDNTAFNKKWSLNIKKINNIKNGKAKSMELGSLYYLLKNLGSEFDKDDPVAAYLKEILDSKLSDYGKVMLDAGELEEIINIDNNNKYRNPPAHTEYLSYDVALECREFFRNNILKIYKATK